MQNNLQLLDFQRDNIKKASYHFEVLIVDDILENIQLAVQVLVMQENINVSVARSGKEALNIVAKKHIDLMLLDVSMPEMDGFAVCKILKSDPKTVNIPIIFLTARIYSEDILKAFEVGAVDYIPKPFNINELVNRVKTQLELKYSRDVIENQNKLLAEQNETLKNLVSTKDKFFSIIAHDLKNPFNTLLNFSQLLCSNLHRYDFEKIEKFVKIIQDSASKGYKLLENLLEWSRSQMGRIEFRPEKINLQTVFEDISTLLSNTAISKNISLKINESLENFILFADMNMTRTILRNLISNALKFTHNYGEVKVSSRIMESNWVEICVSDTGIGISQENIAKLFRIEEHLTTKGTAQEIGTGLGLILCKEFVEKHNGKIWCESEVGRGSKFYFTLPLYVEKLL